MVDLAEIQAAYYMVAATGVIVAAIYYVLNIRTNQRNQELMLKNQALTLEIRQADLIQRYTSLITSKELMSAWSDVVWNQQFSSYEEWVKKYGHKDTDAYNNILVVMGTLNSYGVLYEKKLMDIDTIEKVIQPMTYILAWNKVEPIIKSWRSIYNVPDFYMPFENLYNAIIVRNPKIMLKK